MLNTHATKPYCFTRFDGFSPLYLKGIPRPNEPL